MGKTYYWYSNASMLCGRIAACSGLSVATTSRQRQLRTTAPTGSLEQTITVDADMTVYRGHHLQTEASEPGSEVWAAGDWSVTLKTGATGGNGQVVWDEIYICRANSGCTTYATVASRTGINRPLGGNATSYTKTITGAAQSVGAVTDTLYVVLGFRSKAAGVGTQTVTLEMLAGQVGTPLGNITVSPSAATSSGAILSPTASLGALSVAPSIATASGVVPSPSVTLGALTVSPSIAASRGLLPSPTLALTLTVAPSAATASGAVPYPSTTLTLTVSPTTAAAVGAILSPSVSFGGAAQTISPAVASASGSIPVPDIALGTLTVTPTVAAAVARALDPAIASTLTVSPTTAAARGSVGDPGLVLTLTVSPSVAAAVAASPDPVASLGALLVQPSVAASVASALQPLVAMGSLPAEIVAVELNVDKLRGLRVEVPHGALAVTLNVDRQRAESLER